MMVGAMAEGATSAHALPARSKVRLRSPSKCSGDRPEGLDGREGLGWET
jgi:hypothetical protein